jgi:hypothetical protein
MKPAATRIFFLRMPVRIPVNNVNIACIIHDERLGAFGPGYRNRLYTLSGQIGLYLLSVPVEAKGFINDPGSGPFECILLS